MVIIAMITRSKLAAVSIIDRFIDIDHDAAVVEVRRLRRCRSIVLWTGRISFGGAGRHRTHRTRRVAWRNLVC